MAEQNNGRTKSDVRELIRGWHRLSLEERMEFIRRTGLWVVCAYQRKPGDPNDEGEGGRILAPVTRHRTFGRIISDIGNAVGRMHTMHDLMQRGVLDLAEADEAKYIEVNSPIRLARILEPAGTALREIIGSIDEIISRGFERRGRKPRGEAKSGPQAETSQTGVIGEAAASSAETGSVAAPVQVNPE